ncbi:MAG: ABC transporter substrate-binding protein [Dehalococcoidia bacterium]|nr:ABC transporter substrate-binding protein [Dehalococcoidia bacterium]
MDTTVSRRLFVRIGGLAVVAGACAPTASGPVQTSGAGSGAAKQGWELEWDRLVAAARQEGKLQVQTPAGAGYREVLEAFNTAYPGVEALQQIFGDSATYVPKVRAERQAGVYSLDAALITPGSALQQLKGEGVYDPLRPMLFRPDVVDDKVWDGGFDVQWCDVEKKFAFFLDRDVNRTVYINTDLVKPSEFTSVEDLANPKFKGKLLLPDPRQGAMRLPMSTLWINGKKDLIKKLIIDQEPQIIRDRRQHVEALIRGRFPVSMGLLKAVLNDFKKDGVAKNIVALDFAELDYQPHYVVLAYNRGPNPNATKLFVNWVLTKEGQTAWAQRVQFNANRIDVPIVNPDDAPKPGVVYKNRNQEEIYPIFAEVEKHIGDLLKAAGVDAPLPSRN